MAEEDFSGKSGEELFKEVRRQYGEADVDDYFKAGRYMDEKMRLDLSLFLAHRSEAGAPEPPDLADVKMPELPQAFAAPSMLSLGKASMPKLGANGLSQPRPMMPGGAAVVPGGASGAVAELKAIALFVAKWKLNPSRSKIALAPLTQTRRRYVIDNFEGAKDASPEEMTKGLEDYIKECGETKAWGDAPVAPAMVAVTGMTPRPGMPGSALVRPGLAAMGLKRPLGLGAIPGAGGDAKRPNLGVGVRPPMMAGGGVRPLGLLAARPVGGIRIGGGGGQGW